MMQPTIKHLYVHIPFCASKCDYCAFYSEPAQGGRVDRFLAALEREIERVAARLEPETIFFGGGTPSILTVAQFNRLLTHLRACLPGLESRITSHDSAGTMRPPSPDGTPHPNPLPSQARGEGNLPHPPSCTLNASPTIPAKNLSPRQQEEGQGEGQRHGSGFDLQRSLSRVPNGSPALPEKHLSLAPRPRGEGRGEGPQRQDQPGFEWTVEMNPATVSADKARLLRSFGVNRASMGVQSFDDDLLARLGRVHTPAMAIDSIALLRAAGFDNLNLDFIFAIPGQTPAQWDRTLRRALALEPQHLSTYELTYEDDTPLFCRLGEGGVARLDEPVATAMYERMLELTAEAGFRQYEISNIARPGRECRHNLNAWRGGEYVGVGPSACGYVDGWRYRNVPDIDAYIARIERGESPTEHAERLSPRARAGELVAFALRMNEGIEAAAFERQTGFRLDRLWPDALHDLAGQKLVEWDGRRLRLTPRGRLLADTVAEAFIVVDKVETCSHHPAYGD